MTLFVTYRVPILVEVELSTREVLSVRVIDEAIEGPLEVRDDADEPTAQSVRAGAIDVAQEVSWPGWTFGW